MEYNFFADLLNKYSQLTPWVQGVIGAGFFGMMIGFAYFAKECVAVIMRPFTKAENHPTAENNKKREWKDKYYRGETGNG